MTISTYAELKDEIILWLDRDDLDTMVDSFIRLAESRHRREVRIREMITTSPLTAVTRFAALPTGYLEAKTLRLTTEPLTVLTPLTLHEMNNRRVLTTGKPLFFTTHSEIEFDRSPDVTYTGEIIYYKALSPLSTSTINNALLTVAPDIYLYSALAASAPFLMNDERIAVWNGLYIDAKDSINYMDSKPIGPVQSQVSGSTP